MKLYATTTSERATKGQGGNKNLIIDIMGENLEGIPTRQKLFTLSMTVDNNELKAELLDYTEGDKITLYPRHLAKPKGKRQKDEDYTNLKFYPHKGCNFIKK